MPQLFTIVRPSMVNSHSPLRVSPSRTPPRAWSPPSCPSTSPRCCHEATPRRCPACRPPPAARSQTPSLPPHQDRYGPGREIGNLHRPEVPTVQTPVVLARHKHLTFPHRQATRQVRQPLATSFRIHPPIRLTTDQQPAICHTHLVPGYRRDGVQDRTPGGMPALYTSRDRQYHQHRRCERGTHRVQVIETQRHTRFNVELQPGQTQEYPADTEGDQRIAPGPAGGRAAPGVRHRAARASAEKGTRSTS